MVVKPLLFIAFWKTEEVLRSLLAGVGVCDYTFQEINTSQLGKRNIIFESALDGDISVLLRVYAIFL